MSVQPPNERSVTIASGIIGFGLGGLLDVLIFHLILRLHHLISGIVSPTTARGLQLNLLADGLFSVAMVLIMIVGFVRLWRLFPLPNTLRTAELFVGALVVGIGSFNVYDGIIDHYVLGLHHATQWPPNPGLYDLIWVGGSVVLIAVGAFIIRIEP